jgi:uncharacterized repeat protein (TIGR03803 family)
MKTNLYKLSIFLFTLLCLVNTKTNGQCSEFYGMTSKGGENGYGTIISWDNITKEYSKKFDFPEIQNGGSPKGTLIQANNGRLYGGIDQIGALFEWDPITKIYIIKFNFIGTDYGSHPQGSLMKSSNGKLYGMTSAGGQQGYYGGVFLNGTRLQNSIQKCLILTRVPGIFLLAI